MLLIGIDNGVSGSVAILTRLGKVLYYKKIVVRKELSYTKTVQHITRIDVPSLYTLLKQFKEKDKHLICFMERPMTGPFLKIKSIISGMRALEATLIVLERLCIPYRYIDSKEWQGALLPKGVKKGENKKAAVSIARRLFPKIKTKDADGLLIAEYARRQFK